MKKLHLTQPEAAEEIARQLKLRDLSGLIVIDFIDMINFIIEELWEKLRESIRKDIELEFKLVELVILDCLR